MRIVTLNLDLDDVEPLHAAVEDALGACSCDGPDGERCSRCAALGAIAADLARLGQRAGRPSTAPGAERLAPVTPFPPGNPNLRFRRAHRRLPTRACRRLWLVPPVVDC